MTRTKRFFTALALSIGIGIGLAVGTVLFYVFSAIAYSGSTGNTYDAFLNSVVPLGRFVLGAAIAGCTALLINTVATDEGVLVWVIFFVAVAGGIVIATSPPIAATVLQATTPIIRLAAKVLLTK